VKTIEEYADQLAEQARRHYTRSLGDLEMTLVACALGAEITDEARVEAIRRIVAADKLVSERLAEG
jgi:hypothetical protein